MIFARAIRFRILGLLFVLSFVNYLLRNNISVALPSIQHEFHFTTVELGWVLGSFNFAYAAFQIPGGILGQLLGPRLMLSAIAVAWGVLTILTGLVPGLWVASAAGAMGSLIVVRFLMGVANAPIFPVMAATFANWFPVSGWAFPNAFTSTGLALAQGALGPTVTLLIIYFGWRASFYLLAPLGFAVAAWWWWYGRDRPSEHAAVAAEEIRLIAAGRLPVDETTAARGTWRRVLFNRDVLLLAGAYFCMNYVFYMFAQWLFTYLVEERRFTLLESGFLYALPFIAGAVLATTGGVVCDELCRRIGPRWGCRLPAIIGLLLVGALLVSGAQAPNPYIAVTLLALCFGFTQFTEGPFWAATTFAAGPNTAAATGVLNTGGNIAGFLAPVVGLMVDRLGWMPTLASGSVFAVIGALLWLFVRVRP
jgi:ACS family glucarate transporter-like MFS transporter